MSGQEGAGEPVGGPPDPRSTGGGSSARSHGLRDHAFEGDGRYCAAWIGPSYAGNAETGLVTMRIGCGYSRDTHPDQGRGD